MSDFAKITLQYESIYSAAKTWSHKHSGGGDVHSVGLIIDNIKIAQWNATDTFSSEANGGNGMTQKHVIDAATNNIYYVQTTDIRSREVSDHDQATFVTRFDIILPIRRLYEIQLMVSNQLYDSKYSPKIVVESPGSCPSSFTGEKCDIPVICPPLVRSSLCDQIQTVQYINATGFTQQSFDMNFF